MKIVAETVLAQSLQQIVIDECIAVGIVVAIDIGHCTELRCRTILDDSIDDSAAATRRRPTRF